jgi:hypothetical protein
MTSSEDFCAEINSKAWVIPPALSGVFIIALCSRILGFPFERLSDTKSAFMITGVIFDG